VLRVKKVNFNLTDRQVILLDNLSKKVDMSVSEIIRRAIDDYFLQTGKELLESEDFYKNKN
jgi:predicted DNA-binding protein